MIGHQTLSDYEYRVLYMIRTGEEDNVTEGGALHQALESLAKRGYIVSNTDGICTTYSTTPLGIKYIRSKDSPQWARIWRVFSNKEGNSGKP